MFTVETEFDQTKIVILDDTGQQEDVIVELFDDGVVISQWDDMMELYDSIMLSHNMWNSLLASINSTDGAYKIG